MTGFLRSAESLGELQSKEREMVLLPVKLPSGKKLSLTAGGQNKLVKKIVEEFCPRFTPGGVIAYLGDAGQKQRHVEAGYLERLGVKIDEHGKMPDVVVHLTEKNWLVLIEAVTSHGPIGLKRHNELKILFGTGRAGLVFVTAFLTRRAMTKYLADIAWETEVWVAEAPSHIIHFNGGRRCAPPLNRSVMRLMCLRDDRIRDATKSSTHQRETSSDTHCNPDRVSGRSCASDCDHRDNTPPRYSV